ncbi:hypothetical protein [Prevotella sp. 10(H)]|uniref:hypothetical protein n=1 Tax=Prevotella sp. 10(H) TaxID=1158294 RepID=UPI0004A734C4|nr:hypothetical protein [Prevotella sp. 10(H)]
MNLQDKLSRRIGIEDIKHILYLTHANDSLKLELFDLVIGDDETIGYQAAWIFTHFSSQDNKWLHNKQNELIDELLVCNHGGKRRLILNLLYKQPFATPPRIDFLDFCLERMLSVNELPGVQSLCMKIAYELCRPIPELKQELKTTLEIMEGELCPAIRSVRQNIFRALEKGKSLQKL